MLETSYCRKTSVSLYLKKETLYIYNLPVSKSFDELCVFVKDGNGIEHQTTYLKREKIIKFCFKKLKTGMYYFQLFKKNSDENMYTGFFCEKDVPITLHENRSLKFKTSPVYQHNIDFLKKINTSTNFLKTCLKPTNIYQSNHERIQKLVKSITKKSASDIVNIRNIHRWIASNIYYDKDSLSSGSYKYKQLNSIDILDTSKCVCQGYTDLSIAMLRAIEIPAMGVICYALGESKQKKWTDSVLNSTETNHIVTAAYINNKWSLFDVTWDSTNIYENKKFIKRNTYGHSYKYFDVQLPFFSFSHRLSYFQY
jgi:hypothetical protein